MDILPKLKKATIIEKRELAKNVLFFRFRCNDPSFTFKPGQYGTVIINETTKRQYSFVSSPEMLPIGEFVIDTTPMGEGSQYFLHASVGDTFHMMAPFGKFQLSENSKKKVLVATGTGIAPFRSMLRNAIFNSQFSIYNKNQNSNIQNQKQTTINHQELITKNQDLRSTTYSLYWGLRHEEDMYWQDEIKGFLGQLTGFQYFLCISKPGDNWVGLRGHVTEHVLENEKDFINSEFYLCGNKAMVEDLTGALKRRGVGEENIKTDVFF